MIEISEIRKHQEQQIDDELGAIRKTKFDRLDEYDQKRKQRLLDHETAKAEAESNFPATLEDIKKRIKEAIENGKTSFTYNVSDELRAMYTSILVVNVMPLHGMTARIKYDSLIIEW